MVNQAGAPSTGYKVGKWVAGNRLLVAALVCGAVYALWPDSKPAPSQVANVSPVTPVEKTRPYICGEGLPSRIKAAEDAASKKEFRQAYELLDYCAGMMPKDGDAFRLRAKYLEETKNAADSAEKAVKAAKKKEGVTIGMSQRDALDSSWGKPEHINTTTTASGTSSQWVYGSGNYLYFTDGVLTSIQN